jgi:hypothetical protein
MRASLRFAIVAVLGMAAAACPGTPPDPPLPDGSSGEGGLFIEWQSQPAVIPGPVSAGVTIEHADFRLDDLRVISDSTPIDLDLEELSWSRDAVPGTLAVMGASPGLYSRLRFKLEGKDEEEEKEYAYEITGQADVSGTVRPFTIRDTDEISFSLDFSILLMAGKRATIPVRVEIDKLIQAADFASAPIVDGTCVVENSSAVRDAARTAFGVQLAGPS